MRMDDLNVKQRRGAAGAGGGESEVAPPGSPELNGESNLCWVPLHADSPLGLRRRKENEQLELFSCCLTDAKRHVYSFPCGNDIAWLVVMTCLGHMCFLWGRSPDYHRASHVLTYPPPRSLILLMRMYLSTNLEGFIRV